MGAIRVYQVQGVVSVGMDVDTCDRQVRFVIFKNLKKRFFEYQYCGRYSRNYNCCGFTKYKSQVHA